MVSDVSIQRIVSAYNVEQSKKNVCEITTLSLKVRNPIFRDAYTCSHMPEERVISFTRLLRITADEEFKPTLLVLQLYEIYDF